MTLGIMAFLVGLYVVPLGLVWWGMRIKKATERQRRAFWGAVMGYCIAGILALWFGMWTPAQWSDTDLARGFFGLWAMVLFPAVGAMTAALLTPGRR